MLLFLFAGINANQTIITTTPYLPGNILASGYSGSKFTTQFVYEDSFILCFWTYESQDIIFSNTLVCANVTQNGLQATCMKDNNLITTSLIVTYPLNATNNPAEFLLSCRTQSSGAKTLSSIIIAVRGR